MISSESRSLVPPLGVSHSLMESIQLWAENSSKDSLKVREVILWTFHIPYGNSPYRPGLYQVMFPGGMYPSGTAPTPQFREFSPTEYPAVAWPGMTIEAREEVFCGLHRDAVVHLMTTMEAFEATLEFDSTRETLGMENQRRMEQSLTLCGQIFIAHLDLNRVLEELMIKKPETGREALNEFINKYTSGELQKNQQLAASQMQKIAQEILANVSTAGMRLEHIELTRDHLNDSRKIRVIYNTGFTDYDIASDITKDVWDDFSEKVSAAAANRQAGDGRLPPPVKSIEDFHKEWMSSSQKGNKGKYQAGEKSWKR